MENLKSYARLTIIPNLPATDTGKRFKNSIVLESNNDILAVTTHKEISNPNGTFSIILSPRIAKNIATHTGSLSVSDIITPYSLVQIEFKTSGDYKVEMIGLVSRAAVTMQVDASGTPNRVIKIDGFDMGIVLKNFILYFSPFLIGDSLQAYGGQIVFGTDNNVFNQNNPAQFIQNFINWAVGKPYPQGPTQVFYPLTLPNGLKLTNYMDFNTGMSTAFTKNLILDPFILTNIGAAHETSVFDIAKSYADVPFHEVFMDLRRPNTDANGVVTRESVLEAEKTHRIDPLTNNVNQPTSSNLQPYVFNMRTAPFSQGIHGAAGNTLGWDGITYHDFLTTDVTQQDIATSEENVFNYFDLICERQSFALGDQQLAYIADFGKKNKDTVRFPIQFQDSVNTYGIKRFPITKTKYVEFVSAVNTPKGPKKQFTTNFFPLVQVMTLTRQLFRWFSFGELFETGTITLKGRVGVGVDGVTMGSKLREFYPNGTPTGKEFYIESVMQEFVSGKSLQTTVAVTRGCHHKTWTDTEGNSHKGRFDLVKEAEKQLHLDQKNNSKYFLPIDFEDSPKGTGA